MQIMWLAEKLATVQVHLTLDTEGLRDWKSSNGWEIYMASWQQVDIVAWSTLYCAMRPNAKRGGSNTILRAMAKILNCHWFFNILYCLGRILDYQFGLSIEYIAVPQHGPLPLYTKLEDPSVVNLISYFPRYGRWIIMVTALCLCVYLHPSIWVLQMWWSLTIVAFLLSQSLCQHGTHVQYYHIIRGWFSGACS